MMHAATILVDILRDAWGAIIGLMIAVAGLSVLAQLLKLAGSASLGASTYVAQAVASLAGLVVVALYAFLAIPAIVHAASSAAAGSGGCGPAAELGQAAALVMGAITAVRMAKAAFVSMVSALSGVQGGMSYAVTEAAEALIGMLLISVALPVASAVLGAC